MPCKHEKGTGPCSLKGKQCPVQRRLYRARAYPKMLLGSRAREIERGTASELFVESELLKRGLSVGRPSNKYAKHDLFVRLSGAWWTVQVKTGTVNALTGKLYCNKDRRNIESDLIAIVDLEGYRIRWDSNITKPVPPELLEEA